MATARVKLTGMASYTFEGTKLLRDKAIDVSGESRIKHYESMRGRVEVTRIADKPSRAKSPEKSDAPASSETVKLAPSPWNAKSSAPELREALRTRDIAFGDETRPQLLAILQELEPTKGEG